MSTAAEVEEAPRGAVVSDAPPQVRGFCEREGIASELRIALQLLRRYFPSVPAKVSVKRDPENGEEYVSIHLCPPAGSEDGLWRNFRPYTHDWVDLTRWPARDRFALSFGTI